MPHRFTGVLFGEPTPGAWIFVEVPDALAPPATHGWGRTPVRATVLGATWETSIWRGRDGRSLLPIPKRIRKHTGIGDQVEVTFETR